MKKLLTTKEVTEILQVTRQTIYNWMIAGKLKAYRPGGERVLRFKEEDIEDFIQGGSSLGERK